MYKRKNAMHFLTIGRLTISWVVRKRPKAEGEPLRLRQDHIDLALGLTAIALAGLIAALPVAVWLLQEVPQ